MVDDNFPRIGGFIYLEPYGEINFIFFSDADNLDHGCDALRFFFRLLVKLK